MTGTVDIAGTTLSHRVVLVGLASLAGADGTPAHAAAVRQRCADGLGAVDGNVVGTLTEAEVSRALKELEAEGLVDSSRDETSATGKGRPRYALAADRETLLSELGDDDRVHGLVDRVTA